MHAWIAAAQIVNVVEGRTIGKAHVQLYLILVGPDNGITKINLRGKIATDRSADGGHVQVDRDILKAARIVTDFSKPNVAVRVIDKKKARSGLGNSPIGRP